ncbi:equilibrative nucleoside transporter 1-like [Pollicipes pollicipes]|uniref:equilibrative nucleoside transporter 1-like n=1 Tax=Pollicipes pollicipes TaxID=41117 RepID=UPI0018850D8A|nr:equilibrative nucleoside transporter 1-like [Pollicipes pollicipes]
MMSRGDPIDPFTRLLHTALSTAPSTTEDALAPSPVDKAPQISAWAILLKIKWYALSVFLVYSVTLALFPAVTAKIKWIGSGPADQHSVWATNYFVPVCCFLLYNGCDYLGRIAGGFTVWPRKHQWYLVLAMAVVRLAFFPLLMYCNVDHKHLDTVFNSDIYYIAFMTLFGLSNGYLSTLCMIYGPGLVEREEQNTASSMMAAFLGAGLCIGAFVSNASIQII